MEKTCKISDLGNLKRHLQYYCLALLLSRCISDTDSISLIQTSMHKRSSEDESFIHLFVLPSRSVIPVFG